MLPCCRPRAWLFSNVRLPEVRSEHSCPQIQDDPVSGESLSRRFRWCAVAVFALLAVMALIKHWTFHTYVYDLGIFHQMLWNTARGRWFASSLKHMNYLGDHFSPSMILLAPLTWLPHSVEILLIAQAGTVVGVAYCIRSLALRELGNERTAFILGVATLVYPALFSPILFDLHPEPFMALLLALGLVFLSRERFVAAALCFLVVLGGKEDAGLCLGPLGLVLAVKRRYRTFGLVLATCALTWSALAMFVWMPHFRPHTAQGGWFYMERYAHLGSSVPKIVSFVLLHPLTALWRSVTVMKCVTIVVLIAGFAGAFLRGGIRALAALPLLVAHFLSNRAAQFDFGFQYMTPLVPILAWAAIAGAPKTIARRPRFSFALVLATGLFAGLVPRLFPFSDYLPRPEQAALEQAMRLVPKEASLCVPNRLGAHLSARQDLDLCVLFLKERAQYEYYGWPDSNATYQLFDLAPGNNGVDEEPSARLAALERAGAEVLLDRQGVILLRAGPAVFRKIGSAGHR